MVVPPPVLGSTQKSMMFWKLTFDSQKLNSFLTPGSASIM
jgi:hypothetical protein